MKRLALGLFVLGSVTLAPAVAASPSASGFVGNWTTTDCATSPTGEIHCEVWGDGSVMALHVGVGESPKVTFVDFYAGSCANAGSPNTHWVGAGTGTYEDMFLFASLDKTGCGTYQMGSDAGLQFYYDPGSDSLWEDEDGDEWGYIWYRFP
jgi:hypothetical protein